MALQNWTSKPSGYQATGEVDSAGRMTNATVTDGSGIVRDRGRTFESINEFASWAGRDARVSSPGSSSRPWTGG
jgi:hypothetical protein